MPAKSPKRRSKTSVPKTTPAAVLIIGAKGMLGTALCAAFGDSKVIAWDRAECDITNAEDIREKIIAVSPKIIINAAAYTDVDGAETNKAVAFKVNGDAPGNLANIAADIGAKFVHYSTDYVFSGAKPFGYSEDDVANLPCNVYGASKRTGEERIRAVAQERAGAFVWYIIRTSWLFGPGGKNFVRTIYNAAKDTDELSVVNDQHGKPTYTHDLAVATKEIVFGTFSPGIYHVTNETPTTGITWYEFAKEIISQAHFATRVIPSSSASVVRAAKRPEFSILLSRKLPPQRSWELALADYMKLLLSGKS